LARVENGAPPVLRATFGRGLREAVARAAELVGAGGVVAYPTESFYGLAADATDDKAVARLYCAKRRSPSLPVLILIASADEISAYAEHIPESARRLTAAFWPGGLTLVLRAGPRVAPALTAGTGKIGIRVSSHPVAAALVRACGVPITGTSANISGAPACTTATEVLHQFGGSLELILDGGRTSGKAASTVLDLTVDPPLIIREGMVPRGQLEKWTALRQDADRHPP
jgi:L-threonylcarbamoyladenylate synthase